MAATPLNRFKNQDTINVVGENVRHFRNKLELTQLQLADACEIDVRQIQRIEYGHSDTKLSRLQTVADNLQVTLAELVSKR